MGEEEEKDEAEDLERMVDETVREGLELGYDPATIQDVLWERIQEMDEAYNPLV